MYTFAVFVYAMLSIKSLGKTQFNNGKENPILTILTGKNCVLFNSVQERLLLTFFTCLHNQLGSIHSIMTY